MTDWGQIKIYGEFIRKDPFRLGLHFPAVQAEIGNLNRSILDVGCGDGLFARLLAVRGAAVVGYDRAPERIAEAREDRDGPRLNVTFAVATPDTFSSERMFDDATSVMVLNYASSLEELKAFFRSTCSYLVAGGRFVSVILNPSFSAFESDLVVRRITKLDGNRVKMEFFDDGSRIPKMTAVQHQYTKEEFERAATEGGMIPAPWKPLFATPDAVANLGADFWRLCHEVQPYALFVTRKE